LQLRNRFEEQFLRIENQIISQFQLRLGPGLPGSSKKNLHRMEGQGLAQFEPALKPEVSRTR
jgi:hypothetical protein